MRKSLTMFSQFTIIVRSCMLISAQKLKDKCCRIRQPSDKYWRLCLVMRWHLSRSKLFSRWQPRDKWPIPLSVTSVQWLRPKCSNIEQWVDKCNRHWSSMYSLPARLKLRNWVHYFDKAKIPNWVTLEWWRRNFCNHLQLWKELSETW